MEAERRVRVSKLFINKIHNNNSMIYYANFITVFLATGDSYTSLRAHFRIGKSTVKEIVVETCLAIWHSMKDEVMPPQLLTGGN